MTRAAAIAAIGLLLLGCRWGIGMRGVSANRFTPAPPAVPFRDCEAPSPSALDDLEVEPGRRVAASDWHPSAGGVVVLSEEGNRLAGQTLLLVSASGERKLLPIAQSLHSPINEVHLLARSRPLLIVGEACSTDSCFDQSLLDEIRGVPYHGDLVLTDFEGTEVYRYPRAAGALLSPDLRWLAFWRSSLDGLHNLFVGAPGEGAAAFVAASVEVDPGSGRSFAACWSAGSRYLHVSGTAEGARHISWTYDTVSRELYSHAG